MWNETSDAIVELNQKGCLQPRVRNVGDMNLLSFEVWLPTTIGKGHRVCGFKKANNGDR